MSHLVGATALAVVVLVAVLSILPSHNPETDVAARLTSLFAPGDSSSERYEVSRSAIAAIGQHPLVGYGPDGFLPALRANRTDAYAETFGVGHTTNNAHSIFLQSAVTLGLPGAALLMSALIVALTSRRPAFIEEEQAGGQPLAAAVWLGAFGLLVHLQFSVSVLGSLVPLWVLLALLGGPFARRVEVSSVVSRITAGMAILLVILAVAASALAIAADHAYLDARWAYREGDSTASVRLAQRAHRLNPASLKYARGLADARALAVEQAIARQDPPDRVSALYAEAFEEFSSLLETSPYDYPALAWLAALQARTGRYMHDEDMLDQARQTAQRACALDRHHAEVQQLASGERTEAAMTSARSVLPLP